MHDCAHFQRSIEVAIQQSMAEVRADLTARVMQAIAPALASEEMAHLAEAVRNIEHAHAQTDILGALLQGCAGFATRCALFVARGVSAPIWQASGFDQAAVRGISAQVAIGLGAVAMQSLTPAQGSAVEFDERFIGAAGAPTNGSCVVLPLAVREKVAALIYADAGNDGQCDINALEILVRAAGNRIELAATRKAPAQAAAAAASVAVVPGAPVTVPSASVAPSHSVSTPPVVSSGAAAAAMPAVASPLMPQTRATVAQDANVAPVASEPAQQPAPVDEYQVKARRFAKLLVEEIKLYNQQEVAAGRQAGDLYDRLREPIEKSREVYDKRYVKTPAAIGNYFVQELVRILADNKIALLGPNFPR
jgi:hypothetical protein